MKHQTRDQLEKVAEVLPDTAPPMTRTEKLLRWAELLETQPNRRLATLRETEYQAPGHRERMRSDGSPIAIAFGDPVLRDQGLQNDTYGEAKRFFELSDWQLHEIICYCHYGDTVNAASAAYHVRAATGSSQPGMFSRLRDALVG